MNLLGKKYEIALVNGSSSGGLLSLSPCDVLKSRKKLDIASLKEQVSDAAMIKAPSLEMERYDGKDVISAAKGAELVKQDSVNSEANQKKHYEE